MKILSMVIAVAVAFAFTTFAAAADNKKLLVGKWEAVKSDPGGVPVGTLVEFSADGKLKLTFKKDDKEASAEGTYVLDGDSFTYKLTAGKEERTSKITIKKISETELDTVNPEQKNVSFKKVK